jgi:hypothetical protein
MALAGMSVALATGVTLTYATVGGTPTRSRLPSASELRVSATRGRVSRCGAPVTPIGAAEILTTALEARAPAR